jgi:hypothetical protein
VTHSLLALSTILLPVYAYFIFLAFSAATAKDEYEERTEEIYMQ